MTIGLLPKLDALESALKHQPGKHPQSKHAGGSVQPASTKGAADELKARLLPRLRAEFKKGKHPSTSKIVSLLEDEGFEKYTDYVYPHSILPTSARLQFGDATRSIVAGVTFDEF